MYAAYLWVGVCHEQVLQLLQVWWRGEERLLLTDGQAQPARLSKVWQYNDAAASCRLLSVLH
jgi:hypothetical protein